MSRNSRALIRSAARREFANRGFAGARVARIAADAGVNKQLIFYYFRDKLGLYQTVLEDARRELASTLTEIRRTGSRDLVRLSVRGVYRAILEGGDLARLLVRSLEGDSDLVVQLVEEFRQLVLQGQSLGHFRDDVDPATIARQSVVLLVGFIAAESRLFGGDTAARLNWIDETSDLLSRAVTW